MCIDNDPILPHGLIQVAGVHDREEVQLLLDYGVDIIGIPLRLPVNAEDLSEAEARTICKDFPGKCCIITYLDSAADIIDFSNYMGCPLIQLHGMVELETLKQVKAALPDLRIIKSLVIGRFPMESLLQQVDAFSPYVSAYITDTYNPHTGAEGATGLTHDWQLSRQLLKASSRPLILAGGLNSDNVEAAIDQVHPWGVDVHTGVEDATGRKTKQSLSPFVSKTRRAFSKLELK
ncbi:MAG: phosphoribosylanthranilate isomerase [Puniceicoccaceae bacterium]